LVIKEDNFVHISTALNIWPLISKDIPQKYFFKRDLRRLELHNGKLSYESLLSRCLFGVLLVLTNTEATIEMTRKVV